MAIPDPKTQPPPATIAAAEAQLRRLLQQAPDNAVALHDLGLLAFRDGRLAEALHLLERALLHQPENIAILRSYGQVLRDSGKPAEALASFLRVLDLDPRAAEVWNAAGVCFQESGNSTKALEAYLRAMTLRPGLAETYNNIGVVLLQEGNIEAAIEHFQQALDLDPAYADACNNLALCHRERLDYQLAIETFRKAFQLNPASSQIAGGLGEILSLVYDPEAESILRHSVALAPHDPERHWNLALELLKRGSYPEGWREYEWRWQRAHNANPLRPFPQPFWRGEAGQEIRGATILLHAEQGFGDTLQMLRYLPLVLDRGARVVLEVQRPLLPLVAQHPNVAGGLVAIVGAGDPLPSFDWHTALLSLPLACGTTLDTVPPPIRLTPPAERIPKAPGKPLRIGLAWAGNPGHLRDRERSIPLEILKPLFDLPGCEWVSLQTGPATCQIQSTGLALEQPKLSNFADTAAVLDTLDLVISVDSAVAHLAATQGASTWILLPFVADWRWLQPPTQIDTHTPNPWYPRARIFRQTSFPSESESRRRWKPTVDAVKTALQKLIESS